MSARPSGVEVVADPLRVEASLWRRLRFEDEAGCREALFNRYYIVAREIGRRLFRQRASRRIERGDFEQFAAEGLLQAIDRFDPLLGVPFCAYARRRISGQVTSGVASMSEVDAQLSHTRRVERERIRSLGTDASADAVQTLSEVVAGLAIGLMMVASGLVLETDAADSAPDALDSLAWRQMQRRLGDELARLPEAEATVVRQHYEHGLSFAQVAHLLGLSRGRISQLHRAALDRLRKRIRPWI